MSHTTVSAWRVLKCLNAYKAYHLSRHTQLKETVAAAVLAKMRMRYIWFRWFILIEPTIEHARTEVDAYELELDIRNDAAMRVFYSFEQYKKVLTEYNSWCSFLTGVETFELSFEHAWILTWK
jgi:hypothetical protein